MGLLPFLQNKFVPLASGLSNHAKDPMKQPTQIFVAMAVTLSVALSLSATAQPSEPQQAQTKALKQERVFGSQLMTTQERREYRQRMRTMKTQEERDQFRLEHHTRMQDRATERGLSLPSSPPMQGTGLGPRIGSQPGMGRGDGPNGPGGGLNRPN